MCSTGWRRAKFAVEGMKKREQMLLFVKMLEMESVLTYFVTSVKAGNGYS